jgi:hypothetical protein
MIGDRFYLIIWLYYFEPFERIFRRMFCIECLVFNKGATCMFAADLANLKGAPGNQTFQVWIFKEFVDF